MDGYICVNKRTGVKIDTENEMDCIKNNGKYIEKTDWIDPGLNMFCKNNKTREFYYSKKECNKKQFYSDDVKYDRYIYPIDGKFYDLTPHNWMPKWRRFSRRIVLLTFFCIIYFLFMVKFIFGQVHLQQYLFLPIDSHSNKMFINKYVPSLIIFVIVISVITIIFCPLGICQLEPPNISLK
jgi:hypothetical protein